MTAASEVIGDAGQLDAALRVANERAGKENVGAHRPRTRCMICESAPDFDPRQNRNNLLNDKRFLEKQVGSRLNADEPLRKTTI